MSDILLENLERSIESVQRQTSIERLAEISREITNRLIERHADDLFPDGRFMRGPVDTFDADRPVAAITRVLQARYTMEMSGVEIQSVEDAKEVILNLLTDEVAAEFAQERDRLKEQGLVICPYVLVEARQTVDPTSLQPVIAFWTRYGVDQA